MCENLLHFCNVGLCFSLVYVGDVARSRASDQHEERTFNLSPSLLLK